MLYEEVADKQAKKAERSDNHQKHMLNKSNYIKMVREDMDDRPQEVSGLVAGLGGKSDYMKQMENLEKVENSTFSRMQMTKA